MKAGVPLRLAIVVLVAIVLTPRAFAHHSFAAFFVSDRMTTVKGTVLDFQFRNPHGMIRLTVTDQNGVRTIWKAETNSPSILERRGWTAYSLKSGDAISIEGWPARDGSNYLRMRVVKRADGTTIGIPFDAAEQK